MNRVLEKNEKRKRTNGGTHPSERKTAIYTDFQLKQAMDAVTGVLFRLLSPCFKYNHNTIFNYSSKIHTASIIG